MCISTYKTDYQALYSQAEALVADIPYMISNLANLAALIFRTLEGINWAGFYLTEDKKLILGPFQGKPACIEIPYGKGVCGTAAEKDQTLIIPDVHQFPGHIACDEDSRSEIVIPVHRDGKVIGVLDIDSPIPDRFRKEDQDGLEKIIHAVERQIL